MMKLMILALAVLQILAGVLFMAEAKSAIHQILAAVAFGMGTICVGFYVVIDRLDKGNALHISHLSTLQKDAAKHPDADMWK